MKGVDVPAGRHSLSGVKACGSPRDLRRISYSGRYQQSERSSPVWMLIVLQAGCVDEGCAACSRLLNCVQACKRASVKA